MNSSYSLGFQPDQITVLLSRFSDFTAALVYDDGNPGTNNVWPVGAVIELRFYPTPTGITPAVTWPATIVADRASWHIAASVVASAVIDAGNDHTRLVYTDSALGTLEWAVGTTRDLD